MKTPPIPPNSRFFLIEKGPRFVLRIDGVLILDCFLRIREHVHPRMARMVSAVARDEWLLVVEDDGCSDHEGKRVAVDARREWKEWGDVE